MVHEMILSSDEIEKILGDQRQVGDHVYPIPGPA